MYKGLQHQKARIVQPTTNSKLKIGGFVTRFCGGTTKMSLLELSLLSHISSGE